MQPRILAVYGATGHTGILVQRELRRRHLPYLCVSRRIPTGDIPEAGAQAWRLASCDDPDALDDALRGCAAVINCAGPFLDTAPALIEAALRNGLHYLDVTAEQRSARQSLATYHVEAMERGLAVLPAMGFYGGLADLLAADAARGFDRLDAIQVGVALDSWHPTRGTRDTGDRNTARRLVVEDGKLVPIPRSPCEEEWTFPAPFGAQRVTEVPLSEVVTIHHHIQTRVVRSYMNLAPLRDLRDPDTPPPTMDAETGRSSQRFVMDVRVTSEHRRSRTVASGFDIYAITAPLVVEAGVRILDNPPATGGAFAPAELFDSASFLTSMEPELEITRSRDIAAEA